MAAANTNTCNTNNCYTCPVCEKKIESIFGCLTVTDENRFEHDNFELCLGAIKFFKEQVNSETKRGNTPLRYVTLSYNDNQNLFQRSIESAVRTLLDNGADPHHTGGNISSAYDYAREKNMSKIVQIYDEYGSLDIKEPSEVSEF